MRKILLMMGLLAAATTTPAVAQVSIQIGLPQVSIGINVPTYPQFVRIPGYPVYYAPRLRSNYFFYDGLYWVYRNDNWYASYWYNGPWGLVEPDAVPLFVLRIPVRYYYQRPSRFAGWSLDAPPRWGDVWGSQWQQRRSGWDRWNRNAVPAPAPLPVYQRQYSGSRYPQVNQQPVLQSQNYRYQPHEAVVRQYYQAQHLEPGAAAQRGPQPRQAGPQPRAPQQPIVRQEPRAVPQPQQPAMKQRPEPRPGHAPAPPETRPAQEPRAAPQPRQPQAMQPAPQPRQVERHEEPRGGGGPQGGAGPKGGGEPKGGGGPKGAGEPKGGGGPKGGGASKGGPGPGGEPNHGDKGEKGGK